MHCSLLQEINLAIPNYCTKEHWVFSVILEITTPVEQFHITLQCAVSGARFGIETAAQVYMSHQHAKYKYMIKGNNESTEVLMPQW